jgi:hypothetical protein
MSTQPHLEIFTYGSTINEEAGFPQFTRLPAELRSLVWQYALQTQRFIRVNLEYIADHPGFKPSRIINSSRTKKRHRIGVDRYQLSRASTLLRVNAESREEALRFYRIQMPCVLLKGDRFPDNEELKTGILHFNPEYDFLHLEFGRRGASGFVKLVYDFKAFYDPRHIGILNLSLDLDALTGGDSYLGQLRPSALKNPHIREAFIETFTQLHEVFFISSPSRVRQIYKNSDETRDILSNQTLFNRSYPIQTVEPKFERLKHDPRSISQDLKNMHVGMDPRYALRLWLQLLQKWCVSPTKVEYRFLVTTHPWGYLGGMGKIKHLRHAKQFLMNEDYLWRSPLSARTQSPYNELFAAIRLGTQPPGAEQGKWKYEDLNKAVKPAFGFWLFRVPDYMICEKPDEGDLYPKDKDLVDLSMFSPELCLYNLPA